MTRDYVKKYFIDGNYNCAESILLAANEEYGWHLGEETLRLIGGFGAGMGCGNVCGALCGSIAALSHASIRTKAHETPTLKAACRTLTKEFQQSFGSEMCAQLIPRYRQPDVRCLALVEQTADKLDDVLKAL